MKKLKTVWEVGRKIFNLAMWKRNFPIVREKIFSLSLFILLLVVFITHKIWVWVASRLPFIKTKFAVASSEGKLGLAEKIIKILDRHNSGEISRVYLIEMSLRNMQVKKTRTFITVGGMAIGVGAIVFLVSLGYGLQRMVITRIARLDEMKQAEVVPQPGGKIKIDDKTIADFKNIKEITGVMPMIAVVGRINYQNSVSDMAAYGVTSDYLEQSAIKPVQGKIFDSNEISTPVSEEKGSVSGVQTESVYAVWGEEIDKVEFNVFPETFVKVRKGPSTKSELIGFARRTEGVYEGRRVWGSSYDSDDPAGGAGTDIDGITLGKWIEAEVELWRKDGEEYKLIKDESGLGKYELGYIAQYKLNVDVVTDVDAQVLGMWTEGEVLATDSAELDLGIEALIASEAGVMKPAEAKKVSLPENAKRQAVVNRAMLKVLNIKESEAVGKTFSTSFVITSNLLTDSTEKVESVAADYMIVGVTPDEKTAIFYVPFIDLRSLGVTNYSQIKLVVKDQGDLSRTRNVIETMGFSTRSVADTVAQVNSLFNTIRTLMLLLGMVALAVAALGMFNTLTVSLLERTREVGLMKAMGMKSREVQELFLTESMIMGFFGGIAGILAGLLLGKVLSLILSSLSMFKGAGVVDVSYVPLAFGLGVVALSLLVGILTGLYPARRATRISALDALRYE